MGRRSVWSVSSLPICFDAPVAVAPRCTGTLEVTAQSLTCVRFRWRAITAPVVSSPRSLVPTGAPRLEYKLDISRCLEGGGLDRQGSVLLEDSPQGVAPSEVDVHALCPGTKYFAALAVRFVRLGARKWRTTGLTASFM